MTPKGRPNYARPDTNAQEIVSGLRELGFDVDIMPLPNHYDIVVSGLRMNRELVYNKEGKPTYANFPNDVSVRVEIKRPGESLNANEEAYWEKQNHPDSLIRAETIDDILRWYGRK